MNRKNEPGVWSRDSAAHKDSRQLAVGESGVVDGSVHGDRWVCRPVKRAAWS